MSFKNFLDLRKKVQPQVQIIERIILQKRSWKSDLILTLSVIFVASGVIWGITKADTVIQAISRSQVKNFSVVGIVSNIDVTNIYLEQAKGSDDQGKTAYTLDLSTVTKVETNQYVAITLSDIKVGDKVVIQGKEDGGNITIKRIISFGLVAPKEETATTTEAVATTTASSTEPTPTPASTTESTPTPDAPTIIETITEAVSNVIDAITGSSTASTTVDQTEVATSTSDTSTSTPTPTPEPTATDTPSVIENVTNTITDVINDVTNAVTDAVQNVIETVTGSGEQTPNTEPAPEPDPAPAEQSNNDSESIPAPPTE